MTTGRNFFPDPTGNPRFVGGHLHFLHVQRVISSSQKGHSWNCQENAWFFSKALFAKQDIEIDIDQQTNLENQLDQVHWGNSLFSKHMPANSNMYANDIDSIFPAKCNTTCIYRGNMETMWSHHFWGSTLKHRACYILFHFDMTFLKKVRFLPGWVVKKHPQSHPPPMMNISCMPNSKIQQQTFTLVFFAQRPLGKFTMPSRRPFLSTGSRAWALRKSFAWWGLLHPWKLT